MDANPSRVSPSTVLRSLLEPHLYSPDGRPLGTELLDYICEAFVEELAEGKTTLLSDIRRLLETLITDAGGSPDGEVIESIVCDLACKGVLADITKQPEASGSADVPAGSRCQAVLTADGEWHDAVVVSAVERPSKAQTEKEGEGASSGRSVPLYLVRFDRFGVEQEVSRDQLVLEAERADTDLSLAASCEMCERVLPLTKHHLIPRTTHPRMRKEGWTTDQLSEGVMICRPCHDMVHRAEDEATLAKEWRTLDALKAHPFLKGYIEYARKQKVKSKRIPQHSTAAVTAP
uniref:Tudor domain-containing protein n=1 Tax=Chromera velia CCMP2878 TaxID=1169474 RepID=A0A0G4HK29_9ALVE|eukprot:Cvel_28359.t1-p1 / transcript=Cvel_28359.t1 / gene=Cvel_28359 / organism=Chromera_velia_CCMP2878 / gene_product=hypothetical protein / transcript_product=hypothetical protein / location=Cvel_scaffold3695:4570-5894(+) / protein_length=289 / sequence_SO=supercontig / SO=protein_coding / is_pseudo=false